ncbi:MAG: LysW-gamma-L-lysine carboxypeptidase, partial [Chlamydiales bacterium]
EGAVSEVAADLWQGVRSWCGKFNAGTDRLFDACLPSLGNFVTTSDGLRDRVRVSMSFRTPPGFVAAPLKRQIQELAGDAPVTYLGDEIAWTSPRTSSLARAFSRSFASHGLRPRFKHKTGTSDMNVLGPVWQCPIAAYGPGDSTLDHTPGEHIVLTEYERAIEVLSDALRIGGWAS